LVEEIIGLLGMPILSDWLLGEFEYNTQTLILHGRAGGHVWAGDLKNCNSGYADGHVETRPKARIQWQAKGPGHHVYAY
jgi:prepilin-type processing-associated H-X9-DG protein